MSLDSGDDIEALENTIARAASIGREIHRLMQSSPLTHKHQIEDLAEDLARLGESCNRATCVYDGELGWMCDEFCGCPGLHYPVGTHDRRSD